MAFCISKALDENGIGNERRDGISQEQNHHCSSPAVMVNKGKAWRFSHRLKPRWKKCLDFSLAVREAHVDPRQAIAAPSIPVRFCPRTQTTNVALESDLSFQIEIDKFLAI